MSEEKKDWVEQQPSMEEQINAAKSTPYTGNLTMEMSDKFLGINRVAERIKALNSAVSKAQRVEFYSGVDKTECKVRALLDSGVVQMFLPSDGSFQPELLKESLDLLPGMFVIAIDRFDSKEVHNAVYDAIYEARLKILWDRELTGTGWGTGLYVALLKKII